MSFKIISSERVENGLKIAYEIQELSNSAQTINMQFLLLNQKNEKILESSESREIGAGEKKQFEIILPVGKEIAGDFNLLANINSEKYSTFVQESLVLGKSVSGFGIFNVLNLQNKNTMLELAIVLVFLGFAGFMAYRIVKLRHEVARHRKISKVVKIRTINIKGD